MNKAIVALSNSFTKFRGKKCAPDKLLLLLPGCLQNSKCRQNLRHDPYQCQRCGRCKVKDMLELADEYGITPFVATGGRLAVTKAKGDEVEAVVAVACPKELREGVIAMFPKPVLTVTNLRPNGPCIDTDVELDKVREAIEWFLR